MSLARHKAREHPVILPCKYSDCIYVGRLFWHFLSHIPQVAETKQLMDMHLAQKHEEKEERLACPIAKCGSDPMYRYKLI